MPHGRIAALVKCPFFKKEEGIVITCEGIVDNSSIKLCFTYKAQKNLQSKTFCQKDYQKCEVYRMLMEKYDD